MLKMKTHVTLLLALALPLGACHSFLGIKFAKHSPRAPEVRQAVVGLPRVLAAGSFTEAGRKQLGSGEIGRAVESFQNALGAGEPIAPAANGMAVAYARLGRYDVSRRFFEQAMAADPANPRYAENMTRLMRSSALATRHDADIAAAAIELASMSKSEHSNTSRIKQGAIQRVSRGEIRLITAPAVASLARSRTASLDPRFKPLVRVEFAKKAEPSGALVRIELPQPAATASLKDAASAKSNK